MYSKGSHTVRSHILKAMDYNKSKNDKWKTALQDETILDPMFYKTTFQNSIKYPGSQKAKALTNLI